MIKKGRGKNVYYDGPVDHEHRNEVGDVIDAIVNEYFEGRATGKLKQKDLMDEADFADAVNSIPETAAGLGK